MRRAAFVWARSSEPQPDAMMYIRPEHGGRIRISEDDFVEGGPELVAEVAASSIPFDTGEKLNLYQRYDVQEYIVWRVPEQEIDWYARREGRYVPTNVGRRGHTLQRGLSRPVAGRRRLGTRRYGAGFDSSPTGFGHSATRRFGFASESAWRLAAPVNTSRRLHSAPGAAILSTSSTAVFTTEYTHVPPRRVRSRPLAVAGPGSRRASARTVVARDYADLSALGRRRRPSRFLTTRAPRVK